MFYLLAVFITPLALILNGQPFSAVFNLILIVPSLLLGFIFPAFFLVPSLHAVVAVHMKREDRKHRELVNAIDRRQPKTGRHVAREEPVRRSPRASRSPDGAVEQARKAGHWSWQWSRNPTEPCAKRSPSTTACSSPDCPNSSRPTPTSALASRATSRSISRSSPRPWTP